MCIIISVLLITKISKANLCICFIKEAFWTRSVLIIYTKHTRTYSPIRLRIHTCTRTYMTFVKYSVIQNSKITKSTKTKSKNTKTKSDNFS